jgi:hypothetical protein
MEIEMRYYFQRIKRIAADRTAKSIKRLYALINQPKGDGIDQPIIKNVRRCTICNSSADRYALHFQCTNVPGHFADLNTGIFADHTYPGEE